jgi:hypothetical protein
LAIGQQGNFTFLYARPLEKIMPFYLGVFKHMKELEKISLLRDYLEATSFFQSRFRRYERENT